MVDINARDQEFAAATGANVNATRRLSYFDDPPNAFTDLVVSSHPGDESPFEFRVGESYSLSFSGPDGPASLADATVVRSDTIGPNQGAIVFEGFDADQGFMQVIFAPNFDLEGWYNNAVESGKQPAFYNYDTQPGHFTHVCFTAGTLIATPSGPCPAERLRPGDLVLTLDNGPQPLRWCGRKTVRGTGRSAPVRFSRGALGNDRPLRVSQQHRMLLAGRRVQARTGVPEVLVPAKALINGGTIRLEPTPQVTYVHLLLDAHELLVAENCITESLYLGKVAGAVLAAASAEEAALVVNDADTPGATLPPQKGGLARVTLTVRKARELAIDLGLVPGHDRTPRPEPALLTG